MEYSLLAFLLLGAPLALLAQEAGKDAAQDPAASTETEPSAPPTDAAPAPVTSQPPAASNEAAAVEEKKPELQAEVKAEVTPFGCVMYLRDLVAFHEKEIANAKALIQRWNDKVGATIKRRQDLEKNILQISSEIDELQKSDPKRNKKEIARLNKQMARINKDIKVLGKELKAQCKELVGELKEVSKESQVALKDKFQQVMRDIQETEN